MNGADVRFYTSILMRRSPYLAAITAAVLAIAVAVAFVLPPVYRASAKILVEAPQIPADLARSTVAIQAVQQLQIIRQEITTRNDLLKLADKLEIYAPSKEPPADEDIVNDMRSRITFEEIVLGAPDGGPAASVFSVAFAAAEPVLAAEVANELVDLILFKQQQQRTGRAAETVQFFNQEVARLGLDLNLIEAEILKFKNENSDTLPDSLEFRRNQQTSRQERLISLEREESDLLGKRSSLAESYALTGQLPDGEAATPEQQMLLQLNRALADQLAIFSETSPNILALRRRITSLQETLQGRQAQEAQPSSKKKRHSTFDLQVSYIDERLRAIARERAAITESIGALTKSITATPASETVLNSFERNRANLQTQYNTAIARRAEALMGEKIEKRSDGGRFSILERATPPESPETPKRFRIALMGAVGGVGLAVAFVALLEFLNGTIRRPVELASMLGHKPIATIPYISTAEENRFAIRRTVAAVLPAAAVPALLIAIHYLYLPLSVMAQSAFGWLAAMG
ncbi:GumC family protein [Sinorhizobium meliloti]|uniref:Polysaccharide biosynthesis-related protein n=3 Tax=Rhizobium meliloti TaxID=382 RepID=F7XH24_SINMM|nr:Wzz/FepE/Etk N-terminal domain-containing protein [Sinorhizobium meliloti]AEG56795.1 lipopolysaccharide biosynthesis protein [Sinorhizobium meliloti AK83]AEH83850.1 polysaccharide biosynthesis-related protein [Sinorhizobium meliloti SM11]ASP76223.1 lipopolysaccharide biosynthesis protein [Sinorhizobium meliloti]ASP81633.1 lipopolysaccharide biosynthesis protein [Sinorhizobium meliloti]ASP88651.1 lipopolysaccharide biosynthesis protein [Sinorhizobium meliloti]